MGCCVALLGAIGSRWQSQEGRVEFGLLGPLRVSVDGTRIVVGSGRRRTLLAVLLVAGGSVVSAVRLAELLWEIAGSDGGAARR